MSDKFSFYIHTHTDCVDSLEMCLGQLNKYFPNTKIYVSINEPHHLLDGVESIIYDQTEPMSKRIYDAMQVIDEDIILFLLEDMILYDQPNVSEIKRCVSFMKETNTDSIKMVSVLDREPPVVEVSPKIKIHKTNYDFSLQPCLWKKESFKNLLEGVCCDGWSMETSLQEKFRSTCVGYTYFDGNEKRIKSKWHVGGLGHHESLIFPHTNSAVLKGKWNTIEYGNEIRYLMDMYDIQSDRETHGENDD